MENTLFHSSQLSQFRKRTSTMNIQYHMPIETKPFIYRYHTNNQKYMVSRHLSVKTKSLVMLATALLFDQILPPTLLETVMAFTVPTTSYKYQTLHPVSRDCVVVDKLLFATTAGNAEMEYRQRSYPGNSNDNSPNNTDKSDIYSKSWKQVPGGFVPQFENKSNRQRAPLVAEVTKSTDLISPNLHSSVTKTPSPIASSTSSSTSSIPSPMKKNTTPTTMRIRQLSNIKDYKHYVVDDVDPHKITITVVRFYAPWCRACQAIQQRYYRLAQQYEQRMQSLLPPSPPPGDEPAASRSLSSASDVAVRFMECPVTKDNAVLHQGLGVPSLPYGHIYHSKVGLVEEMKLNKNVFTNFESTLASYVNGYCTVTYNENDNDNSVSTADSTTRILPKSKNDSIDSATLSTFG
jgi:thiol-disulfide isomerase/thioredoxin